MESNFASRRTRLLAVSIASTLMAYGATAVAAEHVKTLVSFTGPPDVNLPSAGLVVGPDGNFYGTSFYGGEAGLGTVYKVTPKGEATTLYSFNGGSDGAHPAAPLIVGEDGTLYGTTEYGGGGPCSSTQGTGCGTVFKITLQGTESIVYAFQGGSDGVIPTASVLQLDSGDLYGTTNGGGANRLGTVFHITPGGTEEVIYTFVDGGAPGPLVQGNDGNFYVLVGSFLGALVRVTPAGDATTLHTFTGGPADAAFPNGILVKDGDGNFYGTAPYGGASGLGAVFKVTPAGVEQLVYSFSGGTTDGQRPNGPVLLAGNGMMYGTTLQGGTDGDGIIYELSPEGGETIVHAFKQCVYTPVQGNGMGLVEGKHKDVFGVTTGGCPGLSSTDTYGSVIRFKAR
jgi:uncharacterized repeat protein (TIGR03803 family)